VGGIHQAAQIGEGAEGFLLAHAEVAMILGRRYQTAPQTRPNGSAGDKTAEKLLKPTAPANTFSVKQKAAYLSDACCRQPGHHLRHL
ncbi:MAG TPA: hypothetical protein PK971_15165, partial [Saprospiraceae bacterium]|nr:hypothetical protein [Saprospiraceae bacterium]